MSPALILGLVGGLLVVAFLANRVFGLTRIPDVLVLMMLGVLLGPARWPKPPICWERSPSFSFSSKAASNSIFATPCGIFLEVFCWHRWPMFSARPW
jgi:Kef-type K+ transport system membrane component KefB